MICISVNDGFDASLRNLLGGVVVVLGSRECCCDFGWAILMKGG